MLLIWEEDALADMLHIRRHIAKDNPSAARRVAQAIQQTVGQLTDFPESGRPGRVADTRELVISHTPYVAAYCVSGETVMILRVLHGAQKWPDHLGSS